jgi:Mg2+ and Co2+ transporter CorA
MSQSKYTKHTGEILDLHSQGKTSAEIAIFLQESYGLHASKSAIRSFLKRYFDQKNPVVQHEKEVRKTIKNDYQEALETFYQINDELGDLIPELNRQIRNKKLYSIIGAIWIFTLFAAFYIGHCFSKIPFIYFRILFGVAGAIFCLSVIILVIIFSKKK